MKKALLFALSMLILLTFIGCQPKEITSAKVYIQQKNYEAALEQLRIASEKYPENANAHFLLGQVYAEFDSLKEMNAAFDKALMADSSYASEISDWRASTAGEAFNKGIRYSEKGNWEDALEWYILATDINPSNSDFWKNLGYTYTKLEQPEKALETYNTALEYDPKDLLIAMETSRFYLSSKEPEDARKALEILDNISEYYPDSANIYTLMSDAYTVLENPDSSMAKLERASELAPDDPLIAFNLGREYYTREEFDKAADYFGKYIEKNEDDASGYYNLILALNFAKRYEDGRKIGKIMTDKFPGFKEAWERYALMLIQSEKKEDKVLANIALSIYDGLKAIEEGNADLAVEALELAKDSSIKDRLPEIIKAGEGDEEVKQKVLDQL